MTDLVIEKGIPFPPENHRAMNGKKGRRRELPWNALEIGDSTLRATPEDAKNGQQWAIRHGRRFVMEKQKDGSGWRVWRRA